MTSIINIEVINVRKIFVLFLSLFIIVGLTGCSTEDKNPLDDILANNPTTDLSPEDPLKVGMDLRWAPFETIDINGDPIGISVDLAYELGIYLNRTIEIVDLEFGSLITAIETEQIDVIISSMSITDERKESINFSDPYFYFPLITVLNKEFNENNSIETKEDLYAIDGVRFVGPKSFVSLSIPREEALNPIIRETNDANAALLEIISGAADAFIISASSAAEYHAANPDTTVLLWDAVDYSPIGMGVSKNNEELLSKLNEFIGTLDEEGGVYDRLSEKFDAVIEYGLENQGLDFYLKDE